MLLGNFQGNVIASYAYEGDEEEVILEEEELDEEDASEAEDSEDAEAEVAEEAAEAEDEDTDEAEAEDSDAEAEDAYAEDDAEDEEEVEADRAGTNWILQVKSNPTSDGLTFKGVYADKQRANNEAIKSVSLDGASESNVTITVNVDLDKMDAFVSDDAGQATHGDCKWFLLGLYTCSDNVANVSYNGAALGEGEVAIAADNNMGAGWVSLWLRAEDVVANPKHFTLKPPEKDVKNITVKVNNLAECNLTTEGESVINGTWGKAITSKTVTAKNASQNAVSCDWVVRTEDNGAGSVITSIDGVSFNASEDGKSLVISGTPDKVSDNTVYIQATRRDNGVKSDWFSVQIKAAAVTATHSPASVDFGTVEVNYDSVSAQKVTLTKTTEIDKKVDLDITLVKGGNSDFEFEGSVAEASIAATGTTYDIMVKPKTERGVGTYEDTISINSAAFAEPINITVSFTVVKDETTDPEPKYSISLNDVTVAEAYGTYDEEKGVQFENITLGETTEAPVATIEIKNVSDDIAANVLTASLSAGSIFTVTPAKAAAVSNNETCEFALSVSLNKITDIGVYTDELVISGNGISVNEIRVPVSINVVKPVEPPKHYSISVCAVSSNVGTFTVSDGNVTAFAFNSVPNDYEEPALNVQFEVINNSDTSITVDDIDARFITGNEFSITCDSDTDTVVSGNSVIFTVSVDLTEASAAGKYDGMLGFRVKDGAYTYVEISFTREKAPEAKVSVSIDGVEVENGFVHPFDTIIKGKGEFETIYLDFLNSGDADGKVFVYETDENGKAISENVLLNISSESANVVSGNGTATISINYAGPDAISVNEAYVKLVLGDEELNITLGYTILNDNVTAVSLTPSENVVSINTLEVFEGYNADIYKGVFTLSNNSTENTDTVLNIRASISGDDAYAFTVDPETVGFLSEGKTASFTVGVSENLSYGVYTAVLTFSADNMENKSVTIEFVVNASDSMHFDVTGRGEAVGAGFIERLENALDARVGKEVSKNGAVYLIDLDGSVSGDDASYDVKYEDGVLTTLSTNTVSAAEARISVSDGDAAAYPAFKSVCFDFKQVVNFDANGGVFTYDWKGVSVNSAEIEAALVPVGGKLSDAKGFKAMPVVENFGFGLEGWTVDGEAFDVSGNVITEDITVSANWHEHQYPASGSENSANVVWHWGDVAEKYAGTYVEIFCTSENCVDREGSKITVSGNDISISINGVIYTCEKDGAVTATASANASSIGRYYTAEQVSVNAAPGHNWKYVSENVVWAADYSSATVDRICQNSFHEGNKMETVSADNVTVEVQGSDCAASGNIIYTATWYDEDGEVAFVSENIVWVAEIGHDYKPVFTWTSNGYGETPSVNAVLVCTRNADHKQTISENIVPVLVSEESGVSTTWKAAFTWDGKVYETEENDYFTVYSHTDHKWSVSFNWTGTVSYDGSAFNVTAVAVCANGNETRDLELSLSYNDAKAQGIRIWTAEVTGIKGDVNVDPDGLKALIGASESRMVYAPDAVISPLYGDIVIVNLEEEYDYTGNKITPAFNIIDEERGEFLAKGVDYTVSYGANKEGTGTITVKGKGNYEGKNTTATFKIVDPRKNLSQEELQALADVKGWNVKADAVTYTGESIKPAVIQVKAKGSRSFVSYTLDDNGEDYYNGEDKLPAIVTFANNVNKGTARITLLGANNSIVKKSFKIKPVDLSTVAGDLEINVEDTVYAVKGATPKITVEYMGNLLIEGQDYKVSYDKKSFKKAGSSSLVITGKGNYTKKTNAVYFGIDQLDLGDIDPDSVALKFKAGTKAGKIGATVLDLNGNALGKKQIKVRVDGMADSAALVAGGEYTVVITATDANLVLGSEIEVPITVGQDFAKVYAKADKNFAKEYTGEGVTLDEEDFGAGRIDVRAGGKNGTPLTLGENFEIAGYTNNVKKGTMTVTLKGIGSYSGTKTVKVKIKAKKLAATN